MPTRGENSVVATRQLSTIHQMPEAANPKLNTAGNPTSQSRPNSRPLRHA